MCLQTVVHRKLAPCDVHHRTGWRCLNKVRNQSQHSMKQLFYVRFHNLFLCKECLGTCGIHSRTRYSRSVPTLSLSQHNFSSLSGTSFQSYRSFTQSCMIVGKIKGQFELFYHNVTSRAPGKDEICLTLAGR